MPVEWNSCGLAQLQVCVLAVVAGAGELRVGPHLGALSRHGVLPQLGVTLKGLVQVLALRRRHDVAVDCQVAGALPGLDDVRPTIRHRNLLRLRCNSRSAVMALFSMPPRRREPPAGAIA